MRFPEPGNYAMYWEQDKWHGSYWFPVQVVDTKPDDEMYPDQRIALLWDVFVPYAESEIDHAVFFPIDGEITDESFSAVVKENEKGYA